ncbi:UNVERIFIED_CONTAM: hypothetical protein Slati_0832100 [Sesamum latifolium]|uniref:Uncharacterized protein n=1 Tax=Sesamum latifolium TaxID=2727402 RepID=A0AAW2XLX9_9LAMI
MPVRNRINIFHAEHYRGNILKPIILLLNLVGHRSQYDAVDLAVVLMHFSNVKRSSDEDPSGKIAGSGLSKT